MTWIHSISSWVPAWVVGAVTIIVPAMIVLALSRWIIQRSMRVVGRSSPFLQRLLARSQGPVSLMLVTVVAGIALAGARFPWEVTAAIGRALAVAFIVAVGWAAAIALDIGVEIYLRRYRTDVEDNLLARKHVTQMRILQRIAKTVLVMLTAAVALTTFDSVRQYGVSLFASAGAAGIVLGFAARPVLSNLLAGLQIAMAQPIRVEDQVVVEGEWGTVETITSTYVVLKLWDLRRMIVPLTYFIEKAFQNWTYENTDLIGSVILRVDGRVEMDSLRRRLDEIVHEGRLWDGKTALLQVTDASTATVEMRALVSARNAADLWNLRCEVREKMIEFLQRADPAAQPSEERLSADLTGPPAVGQRPAPATSASAAR
ncbi:MAG: mechanosensitive ion channel family protein [Alphaproteobacteria bacterium]|nr:mechanosensitive ion channel family protein [Alphaproteobacteria bacterium]